MPLFPARGGTVELCADLPNTTRHCAAYPLYFSSPQDFQRAWAVTLEYSTTLDWGKIWAAAPSTPHLIRRGVPRTSTVVTMPLTGATGQGRAPGMGGRIRKDDDHDLRHAPQRSATGNTNCSPRTTGEGGVDDLTDPPCM